MHTYVPEQTVSTASPEVYVGPLKGLASSPSRP